VQGHGREGQRGERVGLRGEKVHTIVESLKAIDLRNVLESEAGGRVAGLSALQHPCTCSAPPRLSLVQPQQ